MQVSVVRPTCSAAGSISSQLSPLLDEVGSDPVQEILGRPFHALTLLWPARKLPALHSMQRHGMASGEPNKKNPRHGFSHLHL